MNCLPIPNFNYQIQNIPQSSLSNASFSCATSNMFLVDDYAFTPSSFAAANEFQINVKSNASSSSCSAYEATTDEAELTMFAPPNHHHHHQQINDNFDENYFCFEPEAIAKLTADESSVDPWVSGFKFSDDSTPLPTFDTIKKPQNCVMIESFDTTYLELNVPDSSPLPSPTKDEANDQLVKVKIEPSEAEVQQLELSCDWANCGATNFTSQQQLVAHIEKKHVEGKKGEEFTCYWKNCVRKQKAFNARYKLLIHMRVHSGEKPNACPVSFNFPKF